MKTYFWKIPSALVFGLILALALSGCQVNNGNNENDDNNGYPDTVTVAFNLQGGIGTFETSVQIPKGTSVAEPTPPPTKGGYDFVAWFTESTGGHEWDFDTNITEDRTLFARWLLDTAPVDTVTVTFDLQGGTGTFETSVQIPRGTSVAEPMPPPTKGGYDFAAWFTESTEGSEWNFDTNITEDRTLFARWAVPPTDIPFTIAIVDPNGQVMDTLTPHTSEGHTGMRALNNMFYIEARVFQTPQDAGQHFPFGFVVNGGTVRRGNVVRLTNFHQASLIYTGYIVSHTTVNGKVIQPFNPFPLVPGYIYDVHTGPGVNRIDVVITLTPDIPVIFNHPAIASGGTVNGVSFSQPWVEIHRVPPDPFGGRALGAHVSPGAFVTLDWANHNQRVVTLRVNGQQVPFEQGLSRSVAVINVTGSMQSFNIDFDIQVWDQNQPITANINISGDASQFQFRAGGLTWAFGSPLSNGGTVQAGDRIRIRWTHTPPYAVSITINGRPQTVPSGTGQITFDGFVVPTGNTKLNINIVRRVLDGPLPIIANFPLTVPSGAGHPLPHGVHVSHINRVTSPPNSIAITYIALGETLEFIVNRMHVTNNATVTVFINGAEIPVFNDHLGLGVLLVYRHRAQVQEDFDTINIYVQVTPN